MQAKVQAKVEAGKVMAKYRIGSEFISRTSYTPGGTPQISFQQPDGAWTPPAIIPHAPQALPHHMTMPPQARQIAPVPAPRAKLKKPVFPRPVDPRQFAGIQPSQGERFRQPVTPRIPPVQPSPPLPHMEPPCNRHRRDYMPGLGRWLSQARLQEQLEKLEHPYSYAGNDPVSSIDPSGLDPGNRPNDPNDYAYPAPPFKENDECLPQTLSDIRNCLKSKTGAIEGTNWFISQAIGTDPASVGTHFADGFCTCDGKSRRPFSAAVDIVLPRSYGPIKGASRTRQQEREFMLLLEALRNCGFVAWHRWYGQRTTGGRIASTENEIHLIDPSAPCMKPSLQRQVRSFLKGGTGGGYAPGPDRAFLSITTQNKKAVRFRASKNRKLSACCTMPNGKPCKPPRF